MGLCLSRLRSSCEGLEKDSGFDWCTRRGQGGLRAARASLLLQVGLDELAGEDLR